MASEFVCTLHLFGSEEPFDRETRLKAEAYNAGLKLRGQYDEGLVSDRELRQEIRMHVIVTNVTDKLSITERFELLESAHQGAGLKQ